MIDDVSDSSAVLETRTWGSDFRVLRREAGFVSRVSTRNKMMMMSKGDEVEVSSEEEGFRGAWFKGVLEENTTKSGRKKLRVRYSTLLHENGSPLTEFFDQSSIRPVPPEDKFSDIVLKEGVVVDADHKDGWWKGFVIKDLKQEENFLVYFDSPPDILQFHKNQLRPHIHWTGWIWVQPEIRELNNSIFCPGTFVEVSSVIDKEETAWFPAIIIKEIEEEEEEKMFTVKYCNEYLNCNGDERPHKTVDPSCVRPAPPASSVEEYKSLDCVETFRGSSWRQGLVRKILSEKRYTVSVGTTKEESVFKHSELRPFMEWEDGIWRKGSVKQQTVKENPSKSIRKKSMRSCSSGVKPMTPKSTTKCMTRSLNFEENVETLTKAETIAAAEESRKKMAGAVMNDVTPSVIIPQVKSIESVSSVTPSPVITATPLKQPVAEAGGKTSAEKTLLEQVRNQNVLETDSTQQKMPEDENSKEKSRKRKRDPNETAEINNTSKNICNDGDRDVDDQPLSTLIERSPDHTPNMVKNSVGITHVDETQAEDTVNSLPFAKKSPYWKKCESMESFKSVPQRPHFSPLCEANEDVREWSAVGMMVTFYGLLDEVKDLKLDVSPSKLNSLSVSFTELEKHGFDVKAPQLRISKMLSLQDDRTKNTEEKKCFEKKIEEEESETHKVEEELAELKLRLLELQRLEAVAKEKKEAGDKKLVEMRSSVETIGLKLEEVELEFKKTASAPW